MTTTTAIEELEVPIPDYMDRLLAALAKGTRTAKEDVALFFFISTGGTHLLRGNQPCGCFQMKPPNQAMFIFLLNGWNTPKAGVYARKPTPFTFTGRNKEFTCRNNSTVPTGI